jgi:hypothetical protein
MDICSSVTQSVSHDERGGEKVLIKNLKKKSIFKNKTVT